MPKFLLLLSAFVCMAPWAALAADALPFEYQWKENSVYRFRYTKTVTTTADKQKRETAVSGVLIFDVKSVTSAGAVATMRFDSPRVTLPTVFFYSSQFDEPQEQKDKHVQIAFAIEAALKEARWNVVLGKDGLIRLDGRTPPNTGDWMKEVLVKSGFRRKKRTEDALVKVIENDLGFKTVGTDSEIFACLTPQPVENSEAVAKLHPVRTVPRIIERFERNIESGPRPKARLEFKRQAPAKTEVYELPDATGIEDVAIKLQSVATITRTYPDDKDKVSNQAIFDLKIGMLDTLYELYSAELLYTFRGESLTQTVVVETQLDRLAPRIDGEGPPIVLPVEPPKP